jgi:hypothetical protein
MRCGDSFLMTGAGGFGKAHLWIAVTEPQPGSSQIVIVSLTTLRYDRDQTVIFQPGDHPFITHQTIVLYSDTRIVDARRLDAIIRDGTALAHQSCPPPDAQTHSARCLILPFHTAQDHRLLPRGMGPEAVGILAAQLVGDKPAIGSHNLAKFLTPSI